MIRLTAFALCLASPAVAQEIGTCDDYRSSVAMLAEPWEENTKVFGEGEVRLAVIDTFEPAAGAFHLVILSPPYDEAGFGQCALVTSDTGTGFAGLNIAGITSTGDMATGLAFTMPATRWISDSDTFVDAVLNVTLNPTTGAIVAKLD